MTSLISEAKPGDLPERCSSFMNAREKVFRPQWEFPSKKRSRRQPAVSRGRWGDGIL